MEALCTTEMPCTFTFIVPSHLWTTDSELDVIVVDSKGITDEHDLHDFGNLISFMLWHREADVEAAFLKDPSLFKTHDSVGTNVALVAAGQGTPALVDFMLKHGVNAHELGGEDADLLCCAIRENDPKMLTHIVKLGFPVNERIGKWGVTPLMSAVAAACPESVRWLLARGADPNAHNVNHGTPLSLSIANRMIGSDAIFDQLIAAKADIHYRFPDGRNMLDFAIQKRDSVSLEKLVDLGLNVNDKMPGTKTTPLMVAAENGDNVLAKWIISKGGDVKAVDAKGQTVFDYAKRSNTLNTDRFFREETGL
jgi:ankyrin repeat protein